MIVNGRMKLRRRSLISAKLSWDPRKTLMAGNGAVKTQQAAAILVVVFEVTMDLYLMTLQTAMNLSTISNMVKYEDEAEAHSQRKLRTVHR